MLRFNCAFGHSRVYNETRPNLNIPLKDPAYVLIILQRRLHSRSPQKRINDVAETRIRRFPLFPPVPRIPIGNVTRIHNSLYRINTQSLNLARPPFSSLSTLLRPSSLVSARARPSALMRPERNCVLMADRYRCAQPIVNSTVLPERGPLQYRTSAIIIYFPKL